LNVERPNAIGVLFGRGASATASVMIFLKGGKKVELIGMNVGNVELSSKLHSWWEGQK
jgi:hypothetical protein